MIALALGLAVAVGLFWAANAFSRARVADVKGLLGWVAALGGLSLAAMLLLTGRGGLAIGALVFAGPLAWSWWQESRARGAVAAPRMGRVEALAVLGLPATASDSDIHASWVRLMRAVHPDGGGTDWLASRVNQARDVLLKGR